MENNHLLNIALAQIVPVLLNKEKALQKTENSMEEAAWNKKANRAIIRDQMSLN